MLRKYLSESFTLNYKFGLALLFVFGIARFLIVMDANITGDFKYVSVIFLVMCVLPFLLLNKNSRTKIGITKPTNYLWLVVSFFTGILFCSVIYWIGVSLFQKTESNWFYAIGNTYPIDFNAIADTDKLIYFIIYCVIAMTFSPIGEEFLYRGMIHQSLADRYGSRIASYIDSAAFGVTHLAHFGLIHVMGKWQLLLIPGLIWVVLMFISGLLFNLCRNMTGSLTGAILSHAGFNLAMTWYIFYRLFP